MQFAGQNLMAATPAVGGMLAPLLRMQVVRKVLQGDAVADGTLYKGQPDPFQENNIIRPSDSDDQFMDIMRSGAV